MLVHYFIKINDVIFAGVVLAPLLSICFLYLECISALFYFPRKLVSRKWEEGKGKQPSLAILVPAHNEAKYIASTLECLLSQVKPLDKILVIADNCTDNTAVIARQRGVTVIERQNNQQRGKGYALEYGLEALKDNPPQIVIVVDADCQVTANTIANIAYLSNLNNRPVQATYLMEPATKPNIKEKISAFALLLKNLVRPYGLTQLGLPCTLAGSGMAFPWEVLQQVSLGNSKTVDDIQLTVDLSLAGYSPLYCPEGTVIGRLMQQEEAMSQKYRWEHGHLSLLLEQVPRLIKESILQRRFELLILALDISIPPLSLLIVVGSIVTAVTLFMLFLGGSSLPLMILSLEATLMVIAVGSAWVKFGKKTLPLLSLLAIPVYLIWKLPIYISWLLNPVNNRSNWRITERD
jgi:cellulose synthase/poly-beta-1,6-N-acetylglucosamine synthase-like glycosyltransferase